MQQKQIMDNNTDIEYFFWRKKHETFLIYKKVENRTKHQRSGGKYENYKNSEKPAITNRHGCLTLK